MGELTLGKYVHIATFQVSLFTRFLREHGYNASVSETEQALVLMEEACWSPEHLICYWRPVFSHTEDQWRRFPELFAVFFFPEAPRLAQKERVQDDEPNTASQKEREKECKVRYEGPERTLLAYSPNAGAEVSLSLARDLDYGMMKGWTRRILRQWARVRPKQRAAFSGSGIDWRQTIHASFRYGGDLGIWVRRRPKRESLWLIVMIDVSGSMRSYVPFYLGLVWQFMREGARLECFLASNRLWRITPFLRRAHPGGHPVADASFLGGGTKLGWAFSRLRQQYSDLFASRTTFIVISDGYDTGGPGMVAESFVYLASRVRQVIWINPLLSDLNSYVPRSVAMKIVLPYCSEHVGVSDLESWIAYGQSQR